MNATWLAIEIGGTKLQIAVGETPGGVWRHHERLDVDASQGATGILRQMEHTIVPLIERFRPQGISIGFGGPVDSRSGCAVTSHQIEGWDRFSFRRWSQEKFGLSLILNNDCDAAALAEARYGAGQGANRVFYVTVGTGVGGGLVLNQELNGTDRPAIAEIGHLRFGLQATDPEQTVESMASGWSIARCAQRLAAAGRTSSNESRAWSDAIDACTGPTGTPNTQQLVELALQGNAFALQAFSAATRALGWAIAQVITLLAADIVVIGGGVPLAGERLFWQPLRQTVAEYVFPPLLNSYELRPATLGQDVVLHGALALALTSTAVELHPTGTR
ncbi:MAG: ROK family protein [Planctomycetota bacterium]|nr:ROK family protein [Planctomycetota bacterium]